MAMKPYNPSENGGQFLEDLSTAYWLSESLFTALELDLFEIIKQQGDHVALKDLSQILDCEKEAFKRFIDLLGEIGLIKVDKDLISNTDLTKTYLLKASPLYQGHSIGWRKNLIDDWKTLAQVLKAGRRVNFISDTSEENLEKRRENYMLAMDNVAKLKATECSSHVKNLKGNILDVGTGSGAMAFSFLEKFPETSAVLLDIRQMLPQTEKFVAKTAFSDRISLHPGNILEADWELDQKFDLIILSNIVHAYAETEIISILKTAANYLSDDGFLLVHDFFNEHDPIKARLSDINMLLNTYNGKVFSGQWIIETLQENNLETSKLIPLSTDTGVIFAGKENLSRHLNI